MVERSRDRIARVFEHNRWLARQNPAMRERLFDLAQISSVEAGHWLYDAGDEARGLYGLLEGSVRLLAWLERGEYRLVNIAGKGEIFGYAGSSVGGRRQLTAVAREPSQLLYLPEHGLATLAREFPPFWQAFAEFAAGQLQGAVHALVEALNLPPTALIASRLVHFAGLPHAVASREGVSIGLSQQEIGEITGLSRKTVNQVLRAMEDDGYVKTSYRRILVCNAAALRAIVTGSNENE